MKRLAVILTAAMFWSNPVFASSCVVSEFPAGPVQAAQITTLPPLVTSQNISTSAVSAASSPFSSKTLMIRVWCDTQSAVEIGVNGATPTASTTTSIPLSAGATEYFAVAPSQIAAFILRP